jgi:pimeloyl-ACP methyl ester carboxylesterase
MSVTAWSLSRTHQTTQGTIAYEILGQGPPVVLIHGTPSSSYLWRDVAPRLAERYTVHLLDLLGYGVSEKRDGQSVSIEAQTVVVDELLDFWQVPHASVAGHDIGGAIALRLMLLRERRFRRLALCDAVAIAPWITPFSVHVQRHLEAFQTVPEHIHREMVAAHIRTAIAHEMADEQLEPYLRPWLGRAGQAAYYRQVAQFDERHTREVEPRYGEIQVPTLVSWGELDGWLDPRFGHQLAATIPGASLSIIPGAGHFAPADQPEAVATQLAEFFAGS